MVVESVSGEDPFGCSPRWFVGRQENDSLCLAGIEQLGYESDECRIRFLDRILVAIGFVRDESARLVHDRRDERIGVLEVVGNDGPALLESDRIRDVS